MIFAPPLHHKVLSGQKTQHRVPRQPNQWEPVRPGKVYGVQREKNGEWLARIVVRSFRADTLGGMTPKDAQLEGFTRRDQALAWYEEQWQVWDPEHAQPVWVVTFELEPEAERYLTAMAGRDLQPAYTTSGDALDAGAVPPTMSLSTYTKDAHRRAAEEGAAREAERKRLPLPTRLAHALGEAEAKGIPIERQKASIAARIESLERRVESGSG